MTSLYQDLGTFPRIRTIIMATFFLVLLSLMPAPAAPHAELSKTDISVLFRQANDLFHQADTVRMRNPEKAASLYRRAVMRFETIVTKGRIRNGKLYFNIGNAYFRMKDIGRAILYYRRAAQYIPNDRNLCHNLVYARMKRIDAMSQNPATHASKTILFRHYDFSMPVKVTLFSVFFVTIWILAGIRIFFRKPFLGWGLLFAVLLTVLLGGSLLAGVISLHSERPGVIIEESLTARQGDADIYASSFTEPLHAGTELNILERRNNWYHVEFPDSRRCWIPARGVQLVSTDSKRGFTSSKTDSS
jgi:tetratricopeptide (TPR) repeat protein